MNEENFQERFTTISNQELKLFYGKANALLLYTYIKINKNHGDKNYEFKKCNKKHSLKPNQFLTSTRSINKDLKLHRTIIKRTATELAETGLVEFKITPDGYLFSILKVSDICTSSGTLSVPVKQSSGTDSEPVGGTDIVPIGGTDSDPQNKNNINNKINKNCSKERENNITRENRCAREGTVDLLSLLKKNDSFYRNESSQGLLEYPIDEEQRLDNIKRQEREEIEIKGTPELLNQLAESWYKFSSKNWNELGNGKRYRYQPWEFDRSIFDIIDGGNCRYSELNGVFNLLVKAKHKFWSKRFIVPMNWKQVFQKGISGNLLEKAVTDFKKLQTREVLKKNS